EVSCYPSPGLVSPVSNGAHRDMNYYTFIDSTCALIKYFTLIAEAGLNAGSGKELFEKIRTIGIDGEKEMFIKTNGVNTQKGMLFLLGIVCAAVGKMKKEKRTFGAVREIVKEMTAGLVEKELDCLKEDDELSHGKILYLEHKVKGVRGEVENGLPTIFNFSLDFYDKSFDLKRNDRLVHTLIGIMQVCVDTNIIYRHSYEVLLEVQQKAKDIISAGGMKTDQGRKMIAGLSAEFEKRRISPGGCADILGVTVFLHMIRESWETF
ncbi:MAG: triphosphoribosyl-dephospho-CoA synthase CitG, partial [Clostridia bacterium]|nr:triphosphoribosyl-dephospho-CoA synthase CitG [Clostridia bacterium]